MSAPDPVVNFPPPQLDPEEAIRRQRVEAERLARLTPGEWQLWIDGSAARLGIPRATLEASVKAIIAQLEKEARERKAEEERERRRIEKAAERKRQEHAKKKEREFKVLAALPEQDQEARLDDLATRLDEDPAAVREEFALSTSASPSTESVELWPEQVEAAALLTELVRQLRRFTIFRRDTDATAVALWIMFAWIHAVATHSPNLVVTSPEPDCGKSSLLAVIQQLTPRPRSGVELTGPSLYRMVDRDHPTVLADEADDLFQRKPDLRHIVNAGWTRGTKIPRTINGVVHWFDPFCPKAIALMGMNMPRATESRGIILELWPKLADEKVEEFSFTDSPEFQELRRKLARWSADNATMLAELKPTAPPGFNNRRAANWRLLFAIADHAGGAWPAQARKAATRLSRRPSDPSAGIKLLEALRALRGRCTTSEVITSAAIVRELTVDPDSEWREFGKNRRPITQGQIASLLKKYEIFPDTIHPTKRADDSPRGYRWADFDDVFARFLPADPHIRTQKRKGKL
jgi:putative DNA primase/helicase